MRVSKSRNVCGYVKAERRRRTLQARLDAKEAALRPLRDAVAAAQVDAMQRRGRLTGGQMAEADRILRDALPAPRGFVTDGLLVTT